MKRIISILLAAIMLLPFAGCGSSSNQPSNTSAAMSTQPGGTQVTKFENVIDFSIDKTHYDKEERIEVTMDFADVHKDNAVIVIVSSDMPHGQLTPPEENTEEYRWLSDFSEIPFYLWSPKKDGIFDARVYAGSSNEELASATFTVGSATLPKEPSSTPQQDTSTSGEGWPSISYIKDTDKYNGDGNITQVKQWDASGENSMWSIYYNGATFESVESYVTDLVAAGWTNQYADEDGNYMENTTDKGTARAYYCTSDYAALEIQVADFSNSMSFTDKAEFSFNLKIEFSKA